MDEIYGQYNIHEICDAMQVNRGTYYNHLKAKDRLTKYDERRAHLSEQIRNIYEESHKTYGAERIRLALKKQGIKVSKAYVLDLMHEIGAHNMILGACAGNTSKGIFDILSPVPVRQRIIH
ncbi:MAG: IS3 family transposase [Candidatus Saccharibacteria bacterium]|nr:IS3 family transposase [Candidatus Saccharibacteria bacterium]